MRNRESIVIALIAGALVGAVVLGLIGRAAMAGVALRSGVATNWSFAGIAEVVVYGAILGAAGGLVALPTRSHFPTSHYARSTVIAGVLFIGTLVFPLARGQIHLGAGGTQVFTLVLAAAVFLVYASILDSLMSRLERGRTGEE